VQDALRPLCDAERRELHSYANVRNERCLDWRLQNEKRQTARSSPRYFPPYNVHFCCFNHTVISIFNRYALARVILLSYDFRK
ncbi:hypothetical protein, partial [Pseudomonas syringae group genomosp. 3]|uniref:hypothetical protein n=1 Tax=Pseudomonas syringae group genomosp. 3 TaxID=251701 RepID=UPI001C800A06